LNPEEVEGLQIPTQKIRILPYKQEVKIEDKLPAVEFAIGRPPETQRKRTRMTRRRPNFSTHALHSHRFKFRDATTTRPSGNAKARRTAVFCGIAAAFFLTHHALADLTVTDLNQENLASAFNGFGGSNYGFVQDNHNGTYLGYVDTGTTSHTIAPGTITNWAAQSATAALPDGTMISAEVGSYSLNVGNDYISASGSSTTSQTIVSDNDVPQLYNDPQSSTELVFTVDEPTIATVTGSASTAVLVAGVATSSHFVLAGPNYGIGWESYDGESAFFGATMILTPGSGYTLYADAIIELGAQSASYSGIVTLTAYRPLPAGQNQSATVLTGGTGTHHVTVNLQSTNGGQFTGQFHSVPAASYSDPVQMFNATAPTFPLPSANLLLWNVAYTPTDPTETGPVSLTFHYDPTEITPSLDPATLTLFELLNGQWQQLPTTLDLPDNTLSLSTATFAPIALGIGSTPALLGDANADGKVDLNDLNTILNNLGQSTPNWTAGNFDGAATIDLTDLNDVLNNLGTTHANASAQITVSPISTPEPTTFALLSTAFALSLARRRSR
jgi:hypothetical protein